MAKRKGLVLNALGEIDDDAFTGDPVPEEGPAQAALDLFGPPALPELGEALLALEARGWLRVGDLRATKGYCFEFVHGGTGEEEGPMSSEDVRAWAAR